MVLRSLVVGAFMAGALMACRGVLGIEPLDVVASDASVDAAAVDGSAPPGDAHEESAPTEGGPPDPRTCAALSRDACRTCCQNPPFAANYGVMVLALKENCICGPQESSVCGPDCAGQPQCPGSPASSSTAEQCSACIADKVVRMSDAKCATEISACEGSPQCAASLLCFRMCAP